MERNVAVLLHHGLGDVIMSRKLIFNLRNFFTEARIILIVKSNVERKFLETFDIDDKFEIVVLNYTGTLKSKVQVLLRFFSLGFQKLDVLLAVHSSNKVLGNIFSKLMRAKVSIGPTGGKYYSETVNNRDRHKEDYYASFLTSYFNRFKKSNKTEIVSAPPLIFEDKYLDVFPKKYEFVITSEYIVISPGTSPFDTHKRWPSKNYVELIKKLIQHGKFIIVLLGTKSDNDVLNSVYSSFADENQVIIINDLSIKDALFFISNSKLLISACTSSLHMAATVDANMVSIYGPTNYSITGPVSLKNRVVRIGYSCSPCFSDNFKSGCGTPKCMTDIKVGQVYQAVQDSLSGKAVPEYRVLSTTTAKKFTK